MNSALSDNEADVQRWLDQLEASVVAAEKALGERQWRELGEEVVQQRRFTHGLKNALELRVDITPEARQSVDQRISAVLTRRDNQFKRLERFHDEVGRRLRELTQFKFALREMTPESKPTALNLER